jgi:hypothetical protein
MVGDKKGRCEYKHRSYPHGTEISEGGRLMDCINGRWESVVLVSGI